MKILVIEDETGLREAVIEALKQENYLAEGTGDGETGIDMIRSGLYDLVILDIMLPGLSGIDVLTIVRRMKVTIPIILVTALSQLEDKITGMDSGADDYITKPFEMQELLARIRMIDRRNSMSRDIQSNRLTVSDLSLDTDRFFITCEDSGKSVQRAGKEFHILEYLMRNSGQIMTRDQITLRVWGYESDAEYNNVDVYISYLRKKLQYVGTSVRIVAVRGVGYKLEG